MHPVSIKSFPGKFLPGILSLSFLLATIFCITLLGGCKSSKKHTVKVVKPAYHHSWYNHSKDKKTKRTKLAKVTN
jgi:hypothetical protein